MRVGGKPERVEVDDAMLHVAEAVRPKLLADGMFLVGLDIVGRQAHGGQRLQSGKDWALANPSTKPSSPTW